MGEAATKQVLSSDPVEDEIKDGSDGQDLTPTPEPEHINDVEENSFIDDLIEDTGDEDVGAGEPPKDDAEPAQAQDDPTVEGSPGDTDDDDKTKTSEGKKAKEDESGSDPNDPAKAGETQDPQPQAQTPPQSDPQPQQPQPQAAPGDGAEGTPQDINAQFAAFAEQRAGELAEKVYALDEETKELLDTEPSKVIPQLAGRLHMEVLTTALTQMVQIMPNLMRYQNDITSKEQKAEDTFYTAFPDLKEHKETVETFARAFMQANPGATQEQAIQSIGTMASVQLGIALPGAQPAPATPAAQPAPQPQVQPVALTPPAPTSTAGGSGQPEPPGQASVWEELIQGD